MPTILLKLLPGTLPPGICFQGADAEQARLVAYAEALQAVLEGGMSFYNYGDSRPAAEFQAYPWLRTTDMRLYLYSGGWIHPYEELSPYARRLWEGDLTQLKTYEGGDAGASSDRSGPMWEEAIEWRGRIPIGPGSTPGGTAISVATNYGNDRVTLLAANIPFVDHRHYAVANTISGAPLNSLPVATTQLASSGSTGGNENYTAAGTNADASIGRTSLTIDPPSAVSDVDILPPVRGIYLIKRTNRIYRFIP